MLHNRLPRGVWYDAERDRYRCRVYRDNNVIHLSYHDFPEDAIDTLARVKNLTRTPKGTVDDLIEEVALHYATKRPK
jgi:hypothetical protein